MVTDDPQGPRGLKDDDSREAVERPGRRALFTPAIPPTRKTRAPVSTPEATDTTTESVPVAPVPDPAPGVLARAIEQAVTGRGSLDPGAVDETFGPVVTVVNRILDELTETRNRLEHAEEEVANRPPEIKLEPMRDLRPAVEVRDLPLPALLVGRDLGLLEVNEAFMELSGLSADELAGTPLSRFVRRRDGDPPVLALRREAATRASVSLATIEGEARFFEHASPVRNGEGKIEGLFVLYTPDPVPPEAEEDGYARLFEALMQEAPLPIALLDASFRVIDHTPAFGVLLGIDASWLADHPLNELPLVEETGPALEEIVDRGEEAFGEVVIERNGERRRLERYVLPVRDAGGRLFRLLVTVMDRTDADLQAGRIAILEETAASFLEQDRVQMLAIEGALHRLAEGDLDYRLEIPQDSRFAATSTWYNLAIEQLRDRIATLEAQAESVPPEPVPEIDGLMMMSAAEITGLLLGALTGERGERLLLDETDPLMPLRAEVNEALDRLETMPGSSDVPEVQAEASASTTTFDETEFPESGSQTEPEPEPVPIHSEIHTEMAEFHPQDPTESEPIPNFKEEITLSDQTMPQSTLPSPDLMTAPPIEPIPETEMEGLVVPDIDSAEDLGAYVEVVTFEMAGQHYALDIRLAREIVEMIPITPIPRSPSYITGIINLRGEITTILNLYQLLGLPDPGTSDGQKIVVLVPEAAEGSNVGVIVDNVHSVNQVPANRIEIKGEGSSADYTGFVRGIIRPESAEGEEDRRDLVIWIDMPAILVGLIAQSS